MDQFVCASKFNDDFIQSFLDVGNQMPQAVTSKSIYQTKFRSISVCNLNIYIYIYRGKCGDGHKNVETVLVHSNWQYS